MTLVENTPLVPVRLGLWSRLANRDWASGTKAGPGSAMNRDQRGCTWGRCSAWGEEHWSRFVLRTGTDASTFFFIYLFVLFFILGFCTQLESRCPAPLPLTGASVLSLFFASPPCSPPLTLRLLEAPPLSLSLSPVPPSSSSLIVSHPRALHLALKSIVVCTFNNKESTITYHRHQYVRHVSFVVYMHVRRYVSKK